MQMKKCTGVLLVLSFVALNLAALFCFPSTFLDITTVWKESKILPSFPYKDGRVNCEDLEGLAFLINPMDISQLHEITLDCGESQPLYFGRKKDLNDHLKRIAKEFSGRPLVEYYVAGLIVLLRRGIQVESSVQNFRMAWEQHQAALLHGLNSRWLISTCDTIWDLYEDSTERAAAAGCVLFGNTIKLYETERSVSPCNSTQYVEIGSQIKHPKLLYDGIRAFRVGEGDLLKTLKGRVDRFRFGIEQQFIAPKLMLELLSRAEEHDTIFTRLEK